VAPVPEPIFTTLEQGFESMLRTVLGRIAQVDADVARGGFADSIELKRLTDMAVSLRDAMGTSGAPSDTSAEESEDDARTRARRWLSEVIWAELSDEALEEVVEVHERMDRMGRGMTDAEKIAYRTAQEANRQEESIRKYQVHRAEQAWIERGRRCTCQPPMPVKGAK
jgi:hypothetical protein